MTFIPLSAADSARTPDETGLDSNPVLLEIDALIAEGNWKQGMEALILFVVTLSEKSTVCQIRKVYSQTLQLISMADLLGLARLKEYCDGSILQRLSLFPSLVSEQLDLAIAFGDAYVKFEVFDDAMAFYAQAIDISEEQLPVQLDGVHIKASRAFFRACRERFIDVDAYEEDLSTARGQGGEGPFLEALGYIERVRQWVCDEKDLEFIRHLYGCGQKVLLSLSTEKRSTYQQSATSIGKGMVLRQAALERPITEKLRRALKEYREAFRQQLDDHNSTPDEIRGFQRRMAQTFRDFLVANFFQPIADILRKSPCSFSVLAMGSVAKEEMCPFSDLEWLIVIENEKNREAFLPFVEMFELMILSLGETRRDQHFSALSRPEKSGLHSDKGSTQKELVIAPHFPMPRGVEHEFEPHSLPHTMCRTAPLFHRGDDLYPTFNASKRYVLDEHVGGEKWPVRIHRAITLMRYRKVVFNHQEDPFAQVQVDLKTTFIEPLFHLLSDLALFHGLEVMNSLDIVDQLDGAFSKRSQALIKGALAKLYCKRAMLHLEKGEQDERGSPKGLEEIYSLVLQPLYAHLESWLVSDCKGDPFCAVDLPDIAFASQLQQFSTGCAKERVIRFMRLLIGYVDGDSEELGRYYRRLSMEPSLEPLREVFVKGLPAESPLLAIPNRDGFRQSFNLGNAKLMGMLHVITTDIEPTDGLRVKVVGIAGDQPRYLLSDVINHVMMVHTGRCQKGVLRKIFGLGSAGMTTTSSAHDVVRIVGEGYDLHLKEMPAQPMMEYAVHNFTSRLSGEGTTPSILLRFEWIDEKEDPCPILVSFSVEGRCLSEDYHQPVSNRSLTWMLLRALLIKPGDERGSNFIVDRQGLLTCVDNDVALVVPVVQSGISSQVCFKTVLPLISDGALDLEVIRAFLQISPDLLLSAWLGDLLEREEMYKRLFSELERERLYYDEKKCLQFTPKLVLKKGAVAALFTQFIALQDFLRKHKGRLRPLDLLQALMTLEGVRMEKSDVGSKIFRAYSRGKALKLSPSEQLSKIVEEKSNQSITNKEMMRCTVGRTPKRAEIENSPDFSIQEAVEELSCFLMRNYDETLQVTMGDDTATLTADFSKLQSEGKPDLERQQLLMRAFYYHHGLNNFQCVSFLHAHTLTQKELQLFFHEGLTSLTLVDCPAVTSEALVALARLSLKLKALRIENCPKISRIDDGKAFAAEDLSFLELEELHLSHLPNLKDLKIKAPKLKVLRLGSTPLLRSLMNLSASGQNLEELYLDNCGSVPHLIGGRPSAPEALHLPKLERFHLTNCKNFKELRVDTPRLVEFNPKRNPLLQVEQISGPFLTELDRCTFGKKDWEENFGEVGEVPPLPSEVFEILNNPCPFFPKHKILDTQILTLMPKEINGKPLTLEYLKALLESPMTESAAQRSWGIREFVVDEEIAKMSPPQSYWFLMTRDILPGTRGWHGVQNWGHASHITQGVYDDLPHPLEAAVSIAAHYAKTDDLLYPAEKMDIWDDKSYTLISCRGRTWYPNSCSGSDSYSPVDCVCIGDARLDGFKIISVGYQADGDADLGLTAVRRLRCDDTAINKGSDGESKEGPSKIEE